MSGDTTTESDSQPRTETVEVRAEIERDLLDRARECYPATKSKNEFVRRVFERGVCAREHDLDSYQKKNSSGED